MELNTEQIVSQICENIKSKENHNVDNCIGTKKSDDIKRICHALCKTGVDAKVQNINGMYFLTIHGTGAAKAKKRDLALQRWRCNNSI